MSNATTSSTPEMTIGLDLGDRLAHYAVLDGEGSRSASASRSLRMTFERLEGGRKRLLTCSRHYDE